MTKYMKITFQNEEPLKISDVNSSYSGQVNVLTYIPGTAIRGALISNLLANGEFEQYKTMILSDDVAFLNAYVKSDTHELLPSFKGFYEDKSDSKNQAKAVENMLINGEITAGNKRASIGKYCYVEDQCIFYTDVELGSDMKMNKGKGDAKQNVFRNAYIQAGYCFVAYIAVHDNDTLLDKFESVLRQMQHKDKLFLGGSRSYGYGKCRILQIEKTDVMPYTDYAVCGEVKNQAYMMLLSNTSMMNELGEVVGIDTELLRQRLHLTQLKIAFCSTSVVEVKGYNTTWGAHLPSVKMYELGSVFKLSFEGESIRQEVLREVMNTGIGIRNNEGYGRVLFLEDYEKISHKQRVDAREISQKSGLAKEAVQLGKLTAEDRRTLEIAAKGYYLNRIKHAVNAYIADPKNSMNRFKLNSTQLGTIESILNANLYNGSKGFERLEHYFDSAIQKDKDRRILKAVQGRQLIADYVKEVKDTKLSKFLGLPDTVMGMHYETFLKADEIIRIKQNLIILQIKTMNRGGLGDE